MSYNAVAMVKIKICGITNRTDAMAAVDAGADALGFVFYSKSPRAVSQKVAADIVGGLPPFVMSVGVFVDEEPGVVRQIMSDCNIQIAQLHGSETDHYCTALGCTVIKAVRVRDRTDCESMADYDVSAFLLDAYSDGTPGGTGLRVDWELVSNAKFPAPIILAGGLTAENVGEAIRRVRPYGVDVSSGVEYAPGKKDHAKARAFVTAARSALRQS